MFFFGPNWSGAGAKSFKILEPEPKILMPLEPEI